MRTRLPLLAFVLLLLAASPARGSFPGSNGPFVVTLDAGCELGIDLFSIPAGGGEPVAITDTCAAGDGETGAGFTLPDASPDGSAILFRSASSKSGFATVPVAGGALTEIPAPPNAGGELSGGSWAPSGDRIATESDDHKKGYDHGSLFDMPIDGSAAKVIIQQPSCPSKPRFCSTFENPRWSPNGRLLAVEVSTPEVRPGLRNSLKPGIWLVKADTGKPVRRIAKRGVEVDWSPDSKFLVYRTNHQQREIKGGASGGNIFIVDAKGRKTRTLVHKENIADTQPTFAPNGRSVAFIEMRFGAGDVGFDVKPSLWKVRVKNGKPAGKPKKIQNLKEPYVEEGFYHAPELTWPPAA